jgi:hypothetical protein
MRSSPVFALFSVLVLAACSGAPDAAHAPESEATAREGLTLGIPSPIVSPLPPGVITLLGAGHILVSTPNGWIKVYDAQKVADGVGYDAEQNGLHVCGNMLSFALSPDRTKAYAACADVDGTDHANTQDGMAANNVSVSLIDVSDVTNPTIQSTVKSGQVPGLSLVHPGHVSMSPNGKIVLVGDAYDVGPGIRQDVVHELDENLQYVQTIAVSPGTGDEITWGTDGVTAYLGMATSAGFDVLHFRGWVETVRGGVRWFDGKTYTMEVLPATHGTNAVATKRVGTVDVIGALGSYGPHVTPVIGSTVWDGQALKMGTSFQDFPVSIAANPKKAEFYVPFVHPGNVDIVSVSVTNGVPALSVTKSIDMGCNNPSRVAFKTDGSLAFVACNSAIVTIDAVAETWKARSMAALLGPQSVAWIPQ